MSLLKNIYSSQKWEEYLEDLNSKEDFQDRYLISKVEKIIEDGINKVDLSNFPYPEKREIAKYKNSKKRTIYIYPEPHATYLKMINWLLQSDPTYRDKFCMNSYAYQKHKSVPRGVNSIFRTQRSGRFKYFIKSDFSDYFNSIPVDILKTKMDNFFEEKDKDLNDFLFSLINEPKVNTKQGIIDIFNKGVMAGTPISGYLANVYLNEVDWSMYESKIFYVRYADDVLILTNRPEEDLNHYKNLIDPLKVALNPAKTDQGLITEGFEVLGFYFHGDIIDIAEAKVHKMLNRIKRRSRWFKAWEKKNNVKNRTMVRTFIKGMNRKLYLGGDEERMNWTRWYFPNINTTKSLERIDKYMVQYIRYLISGKHPGYKKHSLVEYEYIKKLGYRSLVNEYWKFKKRKNISDEI